MVSSIRKHVYNLINKSGGDRRNEALKKIPAVFNSFLSSDYEGDQFVLKCPENSITHVVGDNSNKTVLTADPTGLIHKIDMRQYGSTNYITFSVDKNKLIEDVLNPASKVDSRDFQRSDASTIVVEFSSPNIAKPFHIGHLRSTVVGQFVANVLGDSHRVIRANYLGDWGTQFGLIQAGLKSMDLQLNDLKVNPLRVINDAYILANQNGELLEVGRKISSLLERGDGNEELKIWATLRDLTIEHLKETYRILNIEFDDYTWESQFAKGFTPILEQLTDLGLVKTVDRQMVLSKGDRNVPLLKSDGTSLYLSRDILAALDRYERYKCNSIKYVIDKSQEDHVDALRFVVKTLIGIDVVDHVKFGKIIGMSSRKGTGVFLSDILDTATRLMAQQQDKSPNTRNQTFEVTQTLAVTALVLYLLKQRRTRDISFDWDLALQSKGDTGVKLQYTHSRLTSLQEKCGVQLPEECRPHLLADPDALSLIIHLERLEQVKALSEVTLESYHLVNYCFKLCNITSICLKKLPVKGSTADVAEQRLLLFYKARLTLSTAMRLLGLKPLKNM